MKHFKTLLEKQEVDLKHNKCQEIIKIKVKINKIKILK